MNEKITQRRNQLKADLAIGRVNLFAAICMSALNLFLRLFIPNVALPFSVYISDFLFTIGAGSSEEGISVNPLFIIIGMAILALLLLCCYNAPKDPIYLKLANAFIWIDFVFNGIMAVYLLITSASFVLLINFAYHIYLAIMVGKAKKAVIGLELIPEYVDENDSFDFSSNTNDEGDGDN